MILYSIFWSCLLLFLPVQVSSQSQFVGNPNGGWQPIRSSQRPAFASTPTSQRVILGRQSQQFSGYQQVQLPQAPPPIQVIHQSFQPFSYGIPSASPPTSGSYVGQSRNVVVDTVNPGYGQPPQTGYGYGLPVQQTAPPPVLYQLDNSITGNPDVVCNPTSIRLTVPMQYAYTGRIYVNGQSERSECIKRFNGAANQAIFEIPIGGCEMETKRVTTPHYGIEYTAPVIVSFHRELLTEHDRVFHVTCKFYQKDRSIGSFYEVGLLPTVVVSSDFPMPACRYTLHVHDPTGPPAEFAKVGDAVYHKWQCDTDVYAIRVKNCVVDDGKTRRYLLIDDAGCSIDAIILGDLQYSPSLNMASVKTHVFKFADRPHVYFKCEIELCLKADVQCLQMTPPICSTTNLPPIDYSNRPVPGQPYRQRDDPEATISQQKEKLKNKFQLKSRVVRSSDLPENFTRLEDNSGEHNSTRPDGETQTGKLGITSPSLYVIDLSDGKKFDSYISTLSSSDVECKYCVQPTLFGALVITNFVTLAIATIFYVRYLRRYRKPQI